MDPWTAPGAFWHPMLKVETDPGSGFCGGVISAISKAEEYLSGQERLYSLGAIVHNEAELSRLKAMGLDTVASLEEVPEGATVLIRAHGEPPETYAAAARKGISLIDCTCPVVLKLQSRIREAHQRGRVLIFGRIGHAEVLGLLGQVGGDAVVVESAGMLQEFIDKGVFSPGEHIEVFSQTTKSPSGYEEICSLLRSRGFSITVHNTICAQVAGRHRSLSAFAASHDVIVFVSGKSSSNGKVLSDLCRSVNPRTYIVGGPEELEASWFTGLSTVGVCGATSTPKWLLEKVADGIRKF